MADNQENEKPFVPSSTSNPVHCIVCVRICLPKVYTCENCLRASYCTLKHQRQHWLEHRINCFPFQIVDHPCSLKGTYCFASRDLKAGELVIEESPAFYGPLTSKRAILCVSCCIELDKGSFYRCSRCGRPVCSEICEKNLTHRMNECKWFGYDQEIANGDLAQNTSPEYHIYHRYLISMTILMLRGIGLQTQNIGVYEELLKLKSQSPNAYHQTAMNAQAQQIIKTLRDLAPLVMLGNREESFNLIFNIFSMNAFKHNDALELNHLSSVALNPVEEYREPMDKTIHRFYALYIKASRLNFSCVPNCTWSICPYQDFKIRIRASVPIKAGEELTIFCDPLMNNFELGTFEREMIMRRHYGTTCACFRCRDQKECGLFSSAVICESPTCLLMHPRDSLPPGYGYFLPLDPLSESTQAIWQCNVCQDQIRQIEICRILEGYEASLNTALCNPDPKIVFRDFVLVENIVSKGLYPNHGLLARATRIVMQVLQAQIAATTKCWEQENVFNLTVDHFDTYIRWGRYLLAVLDRVAPGLSLNRADILLKLSMATQGKLKLFGKTLSVTQLGCEYQFFMEVSREAFCYYMDAFYLPGESINVIARNLFNSMKYMRHTFRKRIGKINYNCNQVKDFIQHLQHSRDPFTLRRHLKEHGF